MRFSLVLRGLSVALFLFSNGDCYSSTEFNEQCGKGEFGVEAFNREVHLSNVYFVVPADSHFGAEISLRKPLCFPVDRLGLSAGSIHYGKIEKFKSSEFYKNVWKSGPREELSDGFFQEKGIFFEENRRVYRILLTRGEEFILISDRDEDWVKDTARKIEKTKTYPSNDKAAKAIKERLDNLRRGVQKYKD